MFESYFLIKNMFLKAPEILMKELYDAKADLWSLGVLLCFMLTGKVPVKPELIQRALILGSAGTHVFRAEYVSM